MARKFTILGHPLAHTISPIIHERLFEMDNKSGEYSVSDIPHEELCKKIHDLNSLDGYNITIPHKVAIIPFLDKLDETSIRYGAVNCVSVKDGVSTGYNTDCYGFLRSIKLSGAKLNGKVLQLGCGGVGRMMAIETAMQGGELTIAVRETSKYETISVVEEIKKLAPDANVSITTMENIQGEFDLLINATPVGMYPHIDACPVCDEVIKNCSVIYDAIYNPVKTELIKRAESFGKKTIGGMAMLIWQAVVAHEIWDSSTYDSEDIAKLITEMEKKVSEQFI